jgi:vancomycin resistance protein YoaR
LKLKDKTIKTSWKTLGFDFNVESTIKKGLEFGKKQGFFDNIGKQVVSILGKYDLDIDTNWSQNALLNFTKLNFSEYLKDSQDANLDYKDGELILIASRSGKAPNWDDLIKKVAKRAAKLMPPFPSYEIEIANVFPEIKDDETKMARLKAEEILRGAPYLLEFKENSWKIDKNALGHWLKFNPVFEKDSNNQILGLGLDKELVTHYLLSIIQYINCSPKKARLNFKEGNLIIEEKSEDGIELLLEESADTLIHDILEGKINLSLVIKEIPAVVSENNLSNLGIDTLLAEGESDYTGSSLSRVNNIRVGSGKFDQHLIKPNEEFSFNETLGEVSGPEGYLPGLVIKENKLVPEFGGGICQVSTTMFRAAINSGLEITERYPHSFPVSYYNPQGFDATIYPPHPDLRFVNNTEGYILIQRKIEGNRLIFEIYGKDEEKKVKVKGPYIYERNEEEDSFKTVLWQEVYNKNGEQISRKGFWSYYQSPSLFPVETEENENEEQREDENGTEENEEEAE